MKPTEIKNVITEILESRKEEGGIKALYFVGCGGSNGALYPAKTFMERECANIKSALINSNEFVYSTPKDLGKNVIVCLSCHKGNTPETINAAKLAKEKLEAAKAFAEEMKEKSITVSIRTGSGGRSFGSVSTKELAVAAKEQLGYELDKKKMVLQDPIKSPGIFTLPIKLHPKVTGELKVIVKEV